MLCENFSGNVFYFTYNCEREKHKERGVPLVLGENFSN